MFLKISFKASENVLKQNLGKLQVLVLIRKLKKATNCDDMLNSFIEVLNTKVSSVNAVMENNLTQFDAVFPISAETFMTQFNKFIRPVLGGKWMQKEKGKS